MAYLKLLDYWCFEEWTCHLFQSSASFSVCLNTLSNQERLIFSTSQHVICIPLPLEKLSSPFSPCFIPNCYFGIKMEWKNTGWWLGKEGQRKPFWAPVSIAISSLPSSVSQFIVKSMNSRQTECSIVPSFKFKLYIWWLGKDSQRKPFWAPVSHSEQLSANLWKWDLCFCHIQDIFCANCAFAFELPNVAS